MRCTTHSLVVHFTLPEGLLLSLYNIPPGLLLVSLVCRCATRPFKIYSPVPLESIENVERWREDGGRAFVHTYFLLTCYAYVCIGVYSHVYNVLTVFKVDHVCMYVLKVYTCMENIFI